MLVCMCQSVSQSYAARRVDRYGLTHRSIPDNGIIYKSGYFFSKSYCV